MTSSEPKKDQGEQEVFDDPIDDPVSKDDQKKPQATNKEGKTEEEKSEDTPQLPSQPPSAQNTDDSCSSDTYMEADFQDDTFFSIGETLLDMVKNKEPDLFVQDTASEKSGEGTEDISSAKKRFKKEDQDKL